MRIIGGLKKGKHLAPIKGLAIRPTSDLVREAIFDLIGGDLDGRIVVDLFAGTGGLGIEALSRGAHRAIFVDSSDSAIGLIRKNLAACEWTSKSEIFKKDLSNGLPAGLIRLFAQSDQKIDLVFLDPPYGKVRVRPLLQELVSEGLLSATAMIVSECSRRDEEPGPLDGLQLIKDRNYGRTRIQILVKKDLS